MLTTRSLPKNFLSTSPTTSCRSLNLIRTASSRKRCCTRASSTTIPPWFQKIQTRTITCSHSSTYSKRLMLDFSVVSILLLAMQPVYVVAPGSPPQQPALPRVENVSCVLPATDHHGGLYIGNYFGAVNVDVLKEYGIRAVLTTSVETRKQCR